ncbi:dTDP-4-dehydrorhamnose 3,5-epimerase [uncultured Rikenella sp.]|uniref:dTDP-4-dehydrorhamnose 3,5-epimerase n=1 Tax=uncultured Rikenella sp. TaxID=368003 RepID=UPI00260A20C1|nr:dTDP-4-dehydrorhamnose 3,5-epimerase [uncultured Rikenella sp.]
MAEFKKVETPIEGLFVIEPTVFGDARGFFMETYAKRDFDAMAGSPVDFVQDNHSKSRRGVLRGLHFQTQHAQGKLIRVVAGAVYDVAVDLRAGSPTYGRWHGVELSAENKRQFYVPAGFAHGFLTLADDTEFLYKCTDYYHPEFDGGVRWNDPQIGVDWRLAEYGFDPSGEGLLLSAKDRVQPLLAEL